ncbi:MAG: hypothetical protein FWF58_02600 [Firmicutes bacterium]|nr:hypothetical protein [Bacillota bacterium]
MINKQGILGDVKYHMADNRKKYIFAVVLLCVAFGFGMSKGLSVLNPISALYQYNQPYYDMINLIGRDSYVLSQILSHLMSMLLIYACCLLYFLSPLCIAILWSRAYNIGIMISLLFRIHGIGAILVCFIAIIPFFIVLYVLLASYTVYLINTSKECYNYGQSKWLFFEIKYMWSKILYFALCICIVCGIGGVFVMWLGSGPI